MGSNQYLKHHSSTSLHLDALNLGEPGNAETSRTESSSILEQMMENACTGSVDLDDDQIDAMTASYSEIFEKSGEKKNEKGLLKSHTVDTEIHEVTGIITGYSDEADTATPVYEGVDPTQGFMAEDRINSFLYQSPLDYSIQERAHITSETEGELAKASSGDSLQLSNHRALGPSIGDGMELMKGNLPMSMVLPSPVPPIDPSAIADLESHARNIATSMDTLIENLTGTLQSISALTVDCVEAYRDAVCKTCDAVDSNIKSMYQLMAKTEELSKSMKPIYHLQEQIKEIRRLLDIFEGIANSGAS